MAAVKVPRLKEEASTNFQWIVHFAIGPHAIHVQARQDPSKQWFPMRYKVTDAKMQAMINDWPTKWREPISVTEISIGPPVDAPVETVHKDDQKSDEESSTETPTDPKA